MDTTLNNSDKKIAELILLNEEGDGYGPQGAYKRQKWREICLYQLSKGSSSFKTWQSSWIDAEREHFDKLEFGYQNKFEDGSFDLPILIQSHRCSLDYVGQKLKGYIAYGLIFEIDALFNNIKIEGVFKISDALFKCKANFDNALFSSDVDFNNAVFIEPVDFDGAIFAGNANFFTVTFQRGVRLMQSKFMNDAWFINSTFKSYTWFAKATFAGGAYFQAVDFKGHTDFSNTTFKSQCRFDGEIKNGILKSNGAYFELGVTFENAIFENVGHFEFSKFITEIPNFLGVSISSTRLEFSDDHYFAKTDLSADAVRRLGFLKRLADEHGQTDQALMFNAFELNAKAKQPDASKLFKLFTWLYEKVSNYGRSFGRPLFTYLGLVSITYILALLAAANNSQQDCKGELWRVFSDWRNNGYPSCISYELPDDKLKLNGYRAAFEYTTYRAAGILDFSDNDKQTVAIAKRLFNADVEPWWMRFWGVFKAIASTALLFLAALGLRNKYRIK
jgi:hypothetical protein